MTKRWRRAFLTATVSIVLGGIAVACTNENDPGLSGPTSEETTGGGGPGTGIMLAPVGTIQSTNPCQRSNPPHFTGDITVGCVDLRGTSKTIPMGSSLYQCEGIGHPTKDPKWVDEYGPYTYPNSTHSFDALRVGGPNYAGITKNPSNYEFSVNTTHPTLPGNPITVRCYVDSYSVTENIVITGLENLSVKSIDAHSGPVKMTPQSTITWDVSAYTDNLNVQNAMYPAPIFTWSSLTPSVATVTSGGVISGVANGTATIRATASNGVYKDFPLTVLSCTAVALTPNSTQQLYYQGATVNVVAGLTCPQGIDPGKELVDWSSTGGVVSVSAYGTYGHGGTINPNVDGGTGTVKSCTRYIVNKVCGQVTVNVARLVITHFDGGPFDILPTGTVEHIGYFHLQYRGVGPALTFSLSCGSTGQITCNGQPTPASTTLSPGGWLDPTSNFTTNNAGSATLYLGATDLGGNLPFTNDSKSITINNNSGSPLTGGLDQYPNPVRANVACTWNASASGGTLPYTYEWTVDGNPVGGNTASLTYTNSGSPFTIAVTITDAANSQIFGSTAIDIAGSGPNCSY